MWEYLAVLLIGFWLGVALFLYISCYCLEEILDLPPLRHAPSSASIGHRPTGASSAHAQLKRLVARVVEEAAALPALAQYASEPSHSPSIESSTYEDLLASAILNKVIERYQNENGSGGRSSGIHSASASPTPSERSSPRSLHSRNLRDITPPLAEEEDVSDWEEGDATDDALEVPRRVPFPEYGGDIVHNTENEERDFDEISGSDLQAADGTWEENWLFQKKKIKNMQSVPVPMLVPNSNTEYRALIGDRDADDTTDLSDNASDAEEERGFKSDIKEMLESKHIIGGQPKQDDDFEPDSLTMIENDFEKLVENEYKDNNSAVDDIINQINDNNVSIVETEKIHCAEKEDGPESILVLDVDSGPAPKAEFALKEEIHRTVNGYLKFPDNNYRMNEDFCNGNPDSHISIKESTNSLSHHEREGEYEETVTVPVQRYADSLRRKHFEDPQEVPTRDTDPSDELIPGTIAYRERKKWQNCVDMPNNPYSPEAIQKRLTAKSTSSLFDMLTTNKIDLDEHKSTNDDVYTRSDKEETPVRERTRSSRSFSKDSIDGSISKSPSPRITKNMLNSDLPQYRRYGRDYYIREAKASSGCRTRGSSSDISSISSMSVNASANTNANVKRAAVADNLECEFTSPGLLIKQFNTIATNQQYTKFGRNSDIVTTPNKDEILIEYDDANESTLFSAKPVVVDDDDTDKKFEEVLQSAYKDTSEAGGEEERESPNDTTNDTEPLKSPISVDASYISSSSLEDSIKIYNVQTGEIVKCKPDNVSDSNDDGNDNADIDNDVLEENGNDATQGTDVLDEIEDAKETNELNDILYQLPKVKELAKKFVSMENLNDVKPIQPYSKRRRSKENILNDTRTDKQANKQAYMHSLTARSISREFREELKHSMATPLTVPGGSKEIPEGIEEVANESVRPGSPLPEPGTIKTKLAFFEGLKSKFNNHK